MIWYHVVPPGMNLLLLIGLGVFDNIKLVECSGLKIHEDLFYFDDRVYVHTTKFDQFNRGHHKEEEEEDAFVHVKVNDTIFMCR